MQPAALLQCIVVYLVALAPNLRHVIDRQIFLLKEENKKDTMGPSTKKPSFTVRTIAKIPMPIRMCDAICTPPIHPIGKVNTFFLCVKILLPTLVDIFLAQKQFTRRFSFHLSCAPLHCCDLTLLPARAIHTEESIIIMQLIHSL